jgi:hypothetical protein
LGSVGWWWPVWRRPYGRAIRLWWRPDWRPIRFRRLNGRRAIRFRCWNGRWAIRFRCWNGRRLIGFRFRSGWRAVRFGCGSHRFRTVRIRFERRRNIVDRLVRRRWRRCRIKRRSRIIRSRRFDVRSRMRSAGLNRWPIRQERLVVRPAIVLVRRLGIRTVQNDSVERSLCIA